MSRRHRRKRSEHEQPIPEGSTRRILPGNKTKARIQHVDFELGGTTDAPNNASNDSLTEQKFVGRNPPARSNDNSRRHWRDSPTNSNKHSDSKRHPLSRITKQPNKTHNRQNSKSSNTEKSLSKSHFKSRHVDSKQYTSKRPNLDTGSKSNAIHNETSQPSNGKTQSDSEKSGSSTKRKRQIKYLILGLLGLIFAWVPSLLFIKLSPPAYKSSWTIVIPGTRSGSTINLDSLGEANTSVNSQYGGRTIDPKVNYKAIVLSKTVLENAATLSDISLEAFGKPKIELIDQTAMMMVSIKASNAEHAQQRAENLYTTFMQELDSLRHSERVIKQTDSMQQLDEYQAAVDETHEALREFRTNSEIVSVEQYKTLIETVGKLTESKRNAETQLAAMSARYAAMERSLGMDPGTAASIIKLRQDLMVQSQLKAYSEAHAALVEEQAVLGPKHPKVVHARSRSQVAYSALVKRADEVLGTSSTTVLDHFMPMHETNGSTLHSQLVQLHGEKLALESEVETLEQKVPEMKTRILLYADEAAQLEVLERDHQIANTILVSATARLDLGKSDIYASYPMTQLLTPAGLPDSPGRLKFAFALLGAMLGSVLLALSLIVMWNRKLWLRLIQKRG